MSRSYGSVLPTSLTHIVPSARGFSPRRPAAVVGTTDETSHAGRPPRRRGGDEPGPADFQGSSGAHRTPHQRRRSAGPSGLSPVGPLPGPTRPRQRETTTLAGAPADVSGGPSQSRRRRGTGSVPSVREYRPDSLSPRRRLTGMRGSGSTHPRAIAVDAEPSSTSAFQGLVRIVATTTKIGTGGRSGPARARTFSTATAAPSYSQPRPTLEKTSRPNGGGLRRGMGATLERPPFSGPVASAGELLHTPWRVPTSVATVLLSGAIDTFRGI